MASDDLSKAAAAMGRKGGKASARALSKEERQERAAKAGRAAALNLSKEERSARAAAGARARWKAKEQSAKKANDKPD